MKLLQNKRAKYNEVLASDADVERLFRCQIEQNFSFTLLKLLLIVHIELSFLKYRKTQKINLFSV